MLITHVIAALTPGSSTLTVSASSLTSSVPAARLLVLSLGTLVVALAFLVLITRYGKAFDRLRFGAITAHTATFLVVVGSNCVHLFIALLTHSQNEAPAIMSEWFGPTLAMGTLWMIGLFTHLVGAVLSRGMEGKRA